MNDKYETPSSNLSSDDGIDSGKTKKPISVVWVIVVSFLVVGAYGSVIIPMMAGVQPKGQAVGSAVFWSGVLGFVICKYLVKRPIFGIILGVVSGLILVRLSGYFVLYLNQ